MKLIDQLLAIGFETIVIDEDGAMLAQYSPYDRMPEFQLGRQAYQAGNAICPFDTDSVSCQAWDRGHEYQAKLERFNRRTH